MKTLILMRHGDASVSAESDFARALTPLGRQQCRRTALSLIDTQLRPDAVVCSSAVRTLQSAQIVAEVLAVPRSVNALTDLYLAEPEGYLAAIRAAGADVATLLVVGHNPGLSDLASLLLKEPVSLGTAARALFRLDADDWNTLGR